MASAVTVFASQARTASENSADQSEGSADRAHFIINVTAVTATPAVTFTVQGKDPIIGTYYDICGPTPAVTATGTYRMIVGPGGGQIPGWAVADFLPDTWRVVATHGDADSITYSVVAVFGE